MFRKKRRYIVFSGVAAILVLAVVFFLNHFRSAEGVEEQIEERQGLQPEIVSFPFVESQKIPAKKTVSERKLKKTSKKIALDKDVVRRPRAAVVEFTIEPSLKGKITGFSVAARLEQALGGKYQLLDRRHIVKVMEELKFQSSDLADDSKASEFGAIAGAEYLITGSVVKIGREYAVVAKIFDLKGRIAHRGEIIVQSLDSVGRDDFIELARLLGMSGTERKLNTDRARLYVRHLTQAKQDILEGNYVEAEKKLSLAVKIEPDSDAAGLLKMTRHELEAESLRLSRRRQYEKAAEKGRQFLKEEKLHDAIKSFRRALSLTGFGNGQANHR